jgi:hypothetical protein
MAVLIAFTPALVVPIAMAPVVFGAIVAEPDARASRRRAPRDDRSRPDPGSG